MRQLLLLVAAIVSLTGCATGPNQDQLLAQSQQSDYFASPQERVMVVIDTVDGTLGQANVQCSVSMESLDSPGSRSGSFEFFTPYVRIFDTKDIVEKLRDSLKDYDKFSEADKLQVKLSINARVPSFIYSCQSQSYGGLVGKIYFDGKEVASDVANTQYAAIGLRYSFPPEVFIPSKKQ